MTIEVPETVAAEIVEASRWLSSRGWVPATAGNFSGRIDGAHMAITASGVEKGELRKSDIKSVSLRDPLPLGVSAETPIHVMLYREIPDARAVLHTHSIPATVVSMAHGDADHITLANYELIKGIRGFSSHEQTLELPLFKNTQDMPAFAESVRSRITAVTKTFGFLLAGHGLYAWGASMKEARRHIEALEFLLTCELERGRYRRG